MENEGVLDRGIYDLSKYKEILEIILLTLGIFVVPMVIPKLIILIFGKESVIASNSQYVVGSIVNLSLIITGINVKGWKKIVGLVTLPSISAILSGYVFKSASIFTVYMIPAIWLGNFALIYMYKYMFVGGKRNYALSAIVAVALKVAVIFLGFNILVWAGVIPNNLPIRAALQTSMGVNQLITASIGSVIAYGVMKLAYKNK